MQNQVELLKSHVAKVYPAADFETLSEQDGVMVVRHIKNKFILTIWVEVDPQGKVRYISTMD